MAPALHVVGSLMVDRVIRVAALPRPGETAVARGVQVVPGGKGANQAAAAALAGARVRMCGRTGAEGAFIVSALAERGVDVSAVRADDATAGNAVVLVEDGGQNAIVIAPESNARLSLEDVRAFLAGAEAGETILLQNACAHLEATIERAARAGLRTWLNAAPADAAIASMGIETLAGLIVNETEAEAMTGHGDPRRALGELAVRVPNGTVVVTLGAGGAIAWSRGRLLEFRTHRVNVVDTVGCGDAFVGAMLAAIVDGAPVERAIRFGNAAGALAATRAGAMPSLPSRAEIDALLSALDA
jgi:ribokinase